MLPVYLEEMYALKKMDPIVWKAFSDGNLQFRLIRSPSPVGRTGKQNSKDDDVFCIM